MPALLPLLAGLLVPAATAAPAAWYHPDQVAGQSALFANASAEIVPAYQDVETALRQLSPAVEDLELASTLAAGSLSSADKAYALDVRKQAAALLVAAQARVDAVQEAYGQSFGAALERALAVEGKGKEVKECAGGGGIQAMMGPGRKPCVGEDLNPALAARLDADEALRAEITQANAQPWPEIHLGGRALAPLALTGDAGHVQLAPLARALWEARLTDRADDLDRALEPLEDALAAGDAQALAQAQGHRAAYDRKLAADGQVLLPLLGESLARLKGGAGADVGLCINPGGLGGCTGADRTAELLPLLVADKKLAKALAALP